jgi:hypothetical protein
LRPAAYCHPNFTRFGDKGAGGPQELFTHLALWAGAPTLLVAVVVWLLGLYQSTKGWGALASSAVGTYQAVQGNLQQLISERKRAAMRLALHSVFAVAFAYMLAAITYGLTQLGEADPNAVLTAKVVETSVTVTALSPATIWTVIICVAGIGLLGIARIAQLTGLQKLLTFLGGLVWLYAWAMGWLLGIASVLGFAELSLGSHLASPPPPLKDVLDIYHDCSEALGNLMQEDPDTAAAAAADVDSTADNAYTAAVAKADAESESDASELWDAIVNIIDTAIDAATDAGE